MGADVAVPAGAEVVDATGRFVTPGIIDAHSHIAADAINEGGTTVSSMTGIEDVFNPTDIDIYRDLAGGVTTANVLHGSANPIGGKNLVIKLRWGKDRTDDFRFAGALPGIKFALGENPKDMRQFGQQGPRRYPTSRMGVEFVIRDAFTRAKAYQAEWAAYAARKQKDRAAVPPRRDLQLEPLVEVLEGRRLVHAHCYRADEILMLLRLAEELGFRIATLQHVLEGYKVAKEIAAHGAGGVDVLRLVGLQGRGQRRDAVERGADDAQGRARVDQLRQRRASRRLNTEAAKSIKWGGLSEDEALALVTMNPATQLRVADRVGLDRGRQGRRPGRLEPPPAQQLRGRRPRVHRRHALLRPVERGRARRRSARAGRPRWSRPRRTPPPRTRRTTRRTTASRRRPRSRRPRRDQRHQRARRRT